MPKELGLGFFWYMTKVLLPGEGRGQKPLESREWVMPVNSPGYVADVIMGANPP